MIKKHYTKANSSVSSEILNLFLACTLPIAHCPTMFDNTMSSLNLKNVGVTSHRSKLAYDSLKLPFNRWKDPEMD